MEKDKLLEQLRIINAKNSKDPWDKDNYVGVEIECSSPVSIEEMKILFSYAELGQYVGIGTDSSIRPAEGHRHTMEIRVIAPEHAILSIMRRVCIILSDASCEANSSCGLHVHLDVRNRSNRKSILKNLCYAQNVLFGLGNQSRENSRYCQPVDVDLIDSQYLNNETGTYIKRDIVSLCNYHHNAINSQNMNSAREKRTIEVRIHRGTVDFSVISCYIKVLMKVVNSEIELEKKVNKKQFIEVFGLSGNLKSYVMKGTVDV